MPENRCGTTERDPVFMPLTDQMRSLIAANLIALLRPQVRGTKWRLYGSSLRLPNPSSGASKRASVVIDGGNYQADAMEATAPHVVMDVFEDFDERDVAAFDSLETVVQYVLVSSNALSVSSWRRNAQGKLSIDQRLQGGQEYLLIDGLGEPLALVDIYDGTGLSSTP